MASSVAGTAFGPILLALGHAASGSYIPVLRWSLLLPAGVAVLALVAPSPRVETKAQTARPGPDGTAALRRADCEPGV